MKMIKIKELKDTYFTSNGRVAIFTYINDDEVVIDFIEPDIKGRYALVTDNGDNIDVLINPEAFKNIEKHDMVDLEVSIVITRAFVGKTTSKRYYMSINVKG